MSAELAERTEEIVRLTKELANQEMAMQREKLAMREMHTLIVRL